MVHGVMSLREKSIVFVGFMGSGKTTVGQLVAQKLYRSFIDIDKEIEKEYNMPTTEIFAKIGEKAFREQEKNIIIANTTKKLKVISLGGGAFLQKEIRDACLENCIVFFLDVSWESWKDRINILIDSRPVLQGKSIEEIEELFYNRQNTYSVHHSKFTTDNHEVEEIADYLIDALKLAWEIHEPVTD